LLPPAVADECERNFALAKMVPMVQAQRDQAMSQRDQAIASRDLLEQHTRMQEAQLGALRGQNKKLSDQIQSSWTTGETVLWGLGGMGVGALIGGIVVLVAK